MPLIKDRGSLGDVAQLAGQEDTSLQSVIVLSVNGRAATPYPSESSDDPASTR